MPEFKYARGRIIETIQFINAEMKEFDSDYEKKTLSDYQKDKKLQKLIDRTAENIITALIEAAGTILTEKGIAVESYTQVLGECAKLYGLSKKEQESLSKLAIQRNRIVHRYLNFRWEAICVFKNTRETIIKLLSRILEGEGR